MKFYNLTTTKILNYCSSLPLDSLFKNRKKYILKVKKQKLIYKLPSQLIFN